MTSETNDSSEANNAFEARARRLHPQLAYQTDADVETITFEREEVLRRLVGRSRVLEVGCATGWFSSVLVANGHDVLAIEGDPRSVAEAQLRGIKVIEADVEMEATWAQAGSGFDAILFMHVLEHLADPWHVLTLAARRLAVGGVVVSLVPNVAAWRVRRSLFFRGAFEYRDTGILDRTHLRFFTLSSGIELHRAAGYGRVEWEPVDTRAPYELLLRHRVGLERLGRAYGRMVTRRFPNLCTEVFLFEAAEPSSP